MAWGDAREKRKLGMNKKNEADPWGYIAGLSKLRKSSVNGMLRFLVMG